MNRLSLTSLTIAQSVYGRRCGDYRAVAEVAFGSGETAGAIRLTLSEDLTGLILRALREPLARDHVPPGFLLLSIRRNPIRSDGVFMTDLDVSTPVAGAEARRVRVRVAEEFGGSIALEAIDLAETIAALPPAEALR